MAVQYLLPCPECAQPIPVTPQLAGGHLDCPACGHNLEVPTLGALRRLESVGEETAAVDQAGDRNRAKGLLFSLGLILTVIFGIGAAVLYFMGGQREIDTSFRQEQIESQLAAIDTAPPADLYAAWVERPKELGEWREDPAASINRESDVLKVFSYILMAVAALGLVLFLTSFALPARRSS